MLSVVQILPQLRYPHTSSSQEFDWPDEQEYYIHSREPVKHLMPELHCSHEGEKISEAAFHSALELQVPHEPHGEARCGRQGNHKGYQLQSVERVTREKTPRDTQSALVPVLMLAHAFSDEGLVQLPKQAGREIYGETDAQNARQHPLREGLDNFMGAPMQVEGGHCVHVDGRLHPAAAHEVKVKSDKAHNLVVAVEDGELRPQRLRIVREEVQLRQTAH
mmetsp:Transcript_24205/g.69009  ORF Transcript_24205/g.69009 Transcript_24205/m.69009 type:complete len:220 (+) Transcript_24205:996-1655(+)